MEELLSSVIRLLGLMISEILRIKLVEVICYSIGFFISKVFTLGRFPSNERSDSERIRVNYIGLISIILALFAVAAGNAW